MILINESTCSDEFNAAFSALKAGQAVRRAGWPAGQYLIMRGGYIRVVRAGADIAPGWAGPSGDESDATDWTIEGATA